jgi:hypothetical protein
VVDSVRENLYCFASELAFWWCGRVSLLITQVKLQIAWSALGRVTAIHYNWWQRSDSCVRERPVSARAFVEPWAFVAMMGWGFIQVRTWFRPGTTVVVVMNGGCRFWAGAKHPEKLTSSFGSKLPWEGVSVADSIRENLYCLASELAFWWCGRVSLLITKVKLQRAWSSLGWVTATCYES